VYVEVSPTVWTDVDLLATKDGDGILIEILRSNSTVLKKFTYNPGKWTGALNFKNASFAYLGDGSGNIKIRISSI
jgi:hypothetical protein